jgi:homoserine O-acetyltransferase
MHERFGRKFQENDPDAFSFKTEYMVESYLHHQGDKFVDRFDANSYLYITRAIDLFDLSSGYGSLIPAFEKVKANYLVISFTSDWLYTSSMSKDIVQALRGNGKNVVYTNIETDKGHDSFLIDNALLQKNISNFLRRQYDGA